MCGDFILSKFQRDDSSQNNNWVSAILTFPLPRWLDTKCKIQHVFFIVCRRWQGVKVIVIHIDVARATGQTALAGSWGRSIGIWEQNPQEIEKICVSVNGMQIWEQKVIYSLHVYKGNLFEMRNSRISSTLKIIQLLGFPFLSNISSQFHLWTMISMYKYIPLLKPLPQL